MSAVPTLIDLLKLGVRRVPDRVRRQCYHAIHVTADDVYVDRDMVDTILAYEGVGLSAFQIGILVAELKTEVVRHEQRWKIGASPS